MMKCFIAVLAVFTAVASAGTVSVKSLLGDEVTPPALQRCEMIFKTCLSPMMSAPNATQNASPEMWSPEMLTRQCSLVTSVNNCFEDMDVDTCLSGWNSMSDVMDYLCNDVFDELMNVSGCVTSPQTKSDLHRCVGVITRGQHSMTTGDMSDAEKCRLMEEYEECVVEVDGTDCGSQARDLYMRIFSRINAIMESQLDCDSEDTLTGDEAERQDPEPINGIPVAEADDSQCELAIGECLTPLEPHRKGFTSFQLETIPQLCSDFEKVQRCIDQHGCEDTTEWTILEDSLEQICGAADKYNAVMPCRKGNIVTQLRSCERDELKEDVMLEDSRVCEIIDEYANCYTVTYSRTCGMVHGKMVSEIMTGIAQVIQLEKDVVCVDSDENPGDKKDNDRVGAPIGDDFGRPSNPPTEVPNKSTAAAPSIGENPAFDNWGPLKKCMGRSAALLMSPLPTHTHQSFDALCNDALRAVQCERIFDDEITDEVRTLWEDFMTAVNYMCVEKRSEFARVYTCLSGLQSPLEKCYATEVSEDLDEKKICEMIDNVEDCTVDTVKDNCGHEAGHLMRGFMKKMNKVLSKQTNINCSWGMKRHLLIGLTAGGAVLLLCVVLSICCAVRRRSRRSVNQEKADLVKHDVLQANLKLTVENENTKDITVMSITQPKA